MLKLMKHRPLQVFDHKEHTFSYIPEMQVFENIPILWRMLEQITEDWRNAAKEFPSFENVEDGDRADLEIKGFMKLRPRLFQCLFS